MKILAIALIALGIIGFVYQGITVTTQKKAVDLGPIEVVKKEKHTLPLPPLIGGLALASGVVLLVRSPK